MTENPSGQTSTRVRLTPSTAIEPLETSRRRPGRVEREGQELPFALLPPLAEDRRGVDMTLDEMAAQAVADAERPLEVDAIARLRRSPRLVRSKVSGPAWTSNRSPSAATTVRQQPLTATLSPIARRSSPDPARPAVNRLPAFSSTTRSTRPSTSTSPVNTLAPPSLTRSPIDQPRRCGELNRGSVYGSIAAARVESASAGTLRAGTGGAMAGAIGCVPRFLASRSAMTRIGFHVLT